MTCMVGLLSRHREGHQRDHARALDRGGHLALVTRAVSRDAAGDDLAAIGDEVLQRLGVLVVDRDVLVGAEAAHLAAGEAALARALLLAAFSAARAADLFFSLHRFHRLLSL